MHLYPILTFLLFFVVNTCDDQITDDQNEVTTLYIHHLLTDCEGVAPQQCMQIKEDPDGAWELFYDRIEGFDFQEGYQYTIEVKITPVENPLADASSLHYQLLKILSKEKITGEFFLQTEGPHKIIYKAFTRGFSKEISITNDYIFKKENENTDTLSITHKNWLALQTLLDQTKPTTWETISPPSTGYRTDAGLHTTISVKYPNQEHSTPTFDEHNPPQRLKPLIDQIRALAKDKE